MVLLLQQYVPLFLAKEDLDIAVQSAYKQRNAAQIKLYRDKANKFTDEYNQVRVGFVWDLCGRCVGAVWELTCREGGWRGGWRGGFVGRVVLTLWPGSLGLRRSRSRRTARRGERSLR